MLCVVCMFLESATRAVAVDGCTYASGRGRLRGRALLRPLRPGAMWRRMIRRLGPKKRVTIVPTPLQKTVIFFYSFNNIS
ncbi:hypothetical protein EDB85DRAFT_1124107 [Lactarius pseudohatsudake]|nr:hypothetical protein EDB85DRAFT_1124107 [Lactarius pseudohatsudake]